jgi:hypothetical protein
MLTALARTLIRLIARTRLIPRRHILSALGRIVMTGLILWVALVLCHGLLQIVIRCPSFAIATMTNL